MSETTTRLMRPDDLGRVLKMAHALAAHHGDSATLTLAGLERDAVGPSPWITILVAENAQGIVGYAALCPLIRLQFGARGMDMHHLFVAPDFRAMGVGRTLIEACRDHCRSFDCRYITVGTHPDNKAAAAVYLAAGFAPLPVAGPRFRDFL